jgi:hypothetical protein
MFSVLLLFAGIAVTAQPASAIVDGQRDEVHTNVGLVRFTTAEGRFRCSGTLISPTVVLTAGHCTGDDGSHPATNVLVSFNTDLALDPLAAGITPQERAARAANFIPGTAHPDPGWSGKLSISKQHDQGVVVLDAPATTKWPDIKPAPLLPVGTLDANQGSLKNQTFVLVRLRRRHRREEGADPGHRAAVHHGAPQDRAGRGRRFQINANNSTAGGGSCFGDSGGPVFLGRFVVGDASYVNSLSCNATGGYQRVDTAYSRAFLNRFL